MTEPEHIPEDIIETMSTTDGAIQGLLEGGSTFLIRLGELVKVATVEDRNRLRKAFPAAWYHAYYHTQKVGQP